VVKYPNEQRELQFTMPLSTTLNSLKDTINLDRILGPTKRDEQRLFYLGRELKSGKKSLSNLGIGNYGVYSIHLLSLAPKVVDLHNDDDDEVDDGIVDSGKRSLSYERRNANNSTLARGGGLDNADGGQKNQNQPQRSQEKVVDLLDSDSDDDDVIEILEASPKKRRKT
jgi:hypothetical protein